MKRIWALVLALLMAVTGACAQEKPIATYILPEGAEAQPVWNTAEWEIPAGLESMYRLMTKVTTTDGSVYLVRMPNGRALVSISCSTPKNQLTAGELLDLWPQIAQNIAKEGIGIDASEDCAVLSEEFGFEALRISTTLYLPDELELKATGAAFFREEELLEIWAVSPVEENDFVQEQTADLLAAASFLSSLDFSQQSEAVQSIPWDDPDGRFSMVIPVGSTVLTVRSTQEEITAAREAYTAAHPEGADVFFNEYITDIFEQRVTVIIAQDQQVVAEVFASQEPDFRGMTADDLGQLAVPIRQSLAERFDVAMLLSAAEKNTISEQAHAWLNYWLRAGETNVQLDVLAAVIQDDWLYEVDIYTHNGDQKTRSLWLTLINQAMQYTPLINALDE